MKNTQVNDAVVLNNEVLTRCFRCSVVRTVGELSVCSECGAATCGMGKCNARCVCADLRRIEHPEDAKTYYSILDELNAGVDPSRIPLMECQLELLEHRHGW